MLDQPSMTDRPFGCPVVGPGQVVIELPGTPAGKGRPRFSRKTGHAYTPAKTRSYESMLQGAAIEAMAGRQPIEGPVAIRVEARFPVPASWSQKKRAGALLGAVWPTGRPDLDNIIKVLDCFNAVVWKDDSQVVEAVVSKRYGNDPQLRVTVWGHE